MKPYALLVLAWLATACLENEEKLTIRADGSVHVKIAAKGGDLDLADGYSVPLRAPWKPVGRVTDDWIQRVGPETGGAETLRKLSQGQVLKRALLGERRLAAERDFARVEDMPSLFADPKDPYAEAFLRRTTSLEVIERGDKTVYVFERVFHARPYGVRLLHSLIEEADQGEDPLVTRWRKGEMEAEDWIALANLAIELHSSLARTFVLESLQAHYLRGTAGLSAEALEGLLVDMNERMQQVFKVESFQTIAEKDRNEDDLLWTASWGEFRSMLRSVVRKHLIDSNLAVEECYAIQFELEREFTEYDHTLDLFGEVFNLAVTLPGTIVTGNFDDKEGATASWRVSFAQLYAGDVKLRAISVLE